MQRSLMSVLLLITLSPVSNAVTLVTNHTATQSNTLYNAVMGSYNNDIRPSNGTDEVVVVDVDFDLNAITDFDEIAGELIVVGVLKTQWDSSTLVWNPDSYDGVGTLILEQDEVWTPPITLYNSMDTMGQIGSNKQKIKVDYTGRTSWAPPVLLKSGCSVNVLYFPFDTQNCSLDLMPWQYLTSEIVFNALSTESSMGNYEEHMVWSLVSQSIEVTTLNGKSLLSVKIELKRRPLYYAVVLIIPVILLGALTPFTFFIPIEEGRVGFAMTVFLTFSVFLILIGDNIPKSSDPMSLLSWYVVCQVGMGGVVTFSCIIGVRWHVKDDEIEVPHCIQRLAAIMTCTVCKRPNLHGEENKRQLTLREKDPHTWINIHGNTFEMRDHSDLPTGIKFGTPNQKFKLIEEKEVVDMDFSEICYVPKTSWVQVARTFDTFFFIFYLGGQIGLTGVFLGPIVFN